MSDLEGGRRLCLACEAPLPTESDLVRVDLRQNEPFLKTALFGMDTNIIVRVAGQALASWNYPTATEM